MNPQFLKSALAHIDSAISAAAEQNRSHGVGNQQQQQQQRSLATRITLASDVDVDWDALNETLSRDLGLKISINRSTAHFIVEGLERGLEVGGRLRHGKGSCTWQDGLKYAGELDDVHETITPTAFQCLSTTPYYDDHHNGCCAWLTCGVQAIGSLIA
jgi:hypothetical protein